MAKKNDIASFFYYMWNCWDELLLLKKPNVDGDIYGTSGVNIIVKMVIMER